MRQEISHLRNHNSVGHSAWRYGKETEGIDSDGLKLFDLSKIINDDLRLSLDPSENTQACALIDQVTKERNELR